VSKALLIKYLNASVLQLDRPANAYVVKKWLTTQTFQTFASPLYSTEIVCPERPLANCQGRMSGQNAVIVRDVTAKGTGVAIGASA